METLLGLFIPCFIDQCAPQVGRAVVRVLDRLQLPFEFPGGQTCCGQPWYNAGCRNDARHIVTRWFESFANYSTVICPSASCVAMLRNHAKHLGVDQGGPERSCLKGSGLAGSGLEGGGPQIFEFTEYLSDVVRLREWQGAYPYRVGIHIGCHGLRELELARPSERVLPHFDKVASVLGLLAGITLVRPKRDECCGFGGTFAVAEPEVSVAMGRDRIADHLEAGAEVIASTDWSCVMHLDGICRREGKPLRFRHVAELLCPEEMP